MLVKAKFETEGESKNPKETPQLQNNRARPTAPLHYFLAEFARASKQQTTKFASYAEPYDKYKYISI